MDESTAKLTDRRRFLRMLLASPALPYLALPPTLVEAFMQEPFNQFREGPPTTELITAASEAMTVFDFEAVAKKKLHYGHVAFLSGTEDEGTYRANRAGFDNYQLRARRLMDVRTVDMSLNILGTQAPSPIIICPCGALGALHPGGEAEVARGVKTKGQIMVLSTAASKPIEEVVEARGEPVWFQLYSDRDWNKTLAMLRRAEAAGSPVVAWTIDGSGGGGKRTIMARARRKDRQFCGNCHKINPKDYGIDAIGSGTFLGTKPMSSTAPAGPPMIDESSTTWQYVKRLKDATKMKVFVKGIVTREDAEIAVQSGVDGVWISNHGGRMENFQRSAVECVPEVVAGVAGRVPVIVDSGFRKGTDIFKGLALGATAVGVGRPYLYGLASFGHEGVEAVLNILDTELRMVMRQTGATTLAKINKSTIVDRTPRT